MMIDPGDDLGTAKAPYKVVACVPVYGRRPLVEQTINRLYKKNGVYKVICSGDQAKDRSLCESLGAVWVPASNRPLGAKWNAAFKAAKEFNPDACLYVGSSDWLCDDWIKLMQWGDLVGVAGMRLIDIDKQLRACHWAGYDNERRGESIGIGRMLSFDLLNKLGWQPFDSSLHNSLDMSMTKRCNAVGVKEKLVSDYRLIALSISHPGWSKVEQNKHKFEDHWNNKLKSERLDPEEIIHHFPEVNKLCESLRATSVRV